MKIMVAFDSSTNAKQALKDTVAMFKGQDPEIILIGVAEEPRDTSSENEAKFQEHLTETQAYLRKAADDVARGGLKCEVIVAQGDVRKMVLTAAVKHKPDLLVVARHNKTGSRTVLGTISALIDELDFMTLGSVSSFLARRAPCPVLIHPCQ